MDIFHWYHSLLFLDLQERMGEIAVITGGARGIGAEVVKQLLQCNMHVIIGEQIFQLNY